MNKALRHLVRGGVYREVVEDHRGQLHEHALKRLPLLAFLVTVHDAHVVKVASRRGRAERATLGRCELQGPRKSHL